MRGVDFSWARPGGAAIKAAGFGFVLRYVPYPGDGGKGLVDAEIADYRANGLGIGLVFESTAQRPLDGHDAGVIDGLSSGMASAAFGFPAGRPVYFACDFDAQPAQFPAIDQYLTGVASVLGHDRVGIYGSYALLAHCQTAGTAAWFWQTTAWSGGATFPDRHLFQEFPGGQINGGDVDYNEAADGDVGLWTTEEDMEDTVLRDAMIKREQIRRVASDPDLPTVEKAFAALKAAGLIT